MAGKTIYPCQTLRASILGLCAGWLSGVIRAPEASEKLTHLACTVCRNAKRCDYVPSRLAKWSIERGLPVRITLWGSSWSFVFPPCEPGTPSELFGVVVSPSVLGSSRTVWPVLFSSFGLPVPDWAA